MKTVKIAKTVEEAIELGLRELQASRSEVEVKVLEEPKAGFLGLIGSKDAVVEITKLEVEEDHLDILSKIENKIEEHDQMEQVRENERLEEEASLEEEIEQVAEEVASEEPVVEIEEEKESPATRPEVKEEPVEQAPAKKEPLVEKEETKQEDLDQEAEVVEEEEVDLAEIRQVANNFLAQMLYEMNLPSVIEFEEKKDVLTFVIYPEDKRNAGIIIGKRGETLDALQYLVNLVANRHSDRYIRIVLDINNYRSKREDSLKNLAKKMAHNSKKYGKAMRLEPMNPFERRIIHSSLQQEKNIHTYSEGKDPNRRVVIEYKEEEE